MNSILPLNSWAAVPWTCLRTCCQGNKGAMLSHRLCARVEKKRVSRVEGRNDWADVCGGADLVGVEASPSLPRISDGVVRLGSWSRTSLKNVGKSPPANFFCVHFLCHAPFAPPPPENINWSQRFSVRKPNFFRISNSKLKIAPALSGGSGSLTFQGPNL